MTEQVQKPRFGGQFRTHARHSYRRRPGDMYHAPGGRWLNAPGFRGFQEVLASLILMGDNFAGAAALSGLFRAIPRWTVSASGWSVPERAGPARPAP